MAATLDDYAGPALTALGGDHATARRGYLALLARSDLPVWMVGAIHIDLSGMALTAGDHAGALDAFDRAVDAGFCDVLGLSRNEGIAAVAQHPQFRAAYAKIRLSPADFQEITWIHGEIQHLFHETTLLITQQINRADSDPTELVQLPVPDREPQSPGVWGVRALMLVVQHLQRQQVGSADQSRILNHMQRSAIDSMTGRNRSHEVFASRQLEQQRLAQRRAAAQQRAFRLPFGISTTLSGPPPLG